jgi:hypothetical protein
VSPAVPPPSVARLARPPTRPPSQTLSEPLSDATVFGYGFIAAGGVVAVLVGDAVKAKQAIAYGLGWQGLIGGFLQGTVGNPAGGGSGGGGSS